MKNPTQKDVARMAGVSRATVSHVLNDRNDTKIPISAETRQKVLDAIEALGYEPDVGAQSLRKGSTKTFGVLFPTLQNPHFVHLLSGIQTEAQQAGYSIQLSQSSLDPKQEQANLKELMRYKLDGIILLTHFKLLSSVTVTRIHRSGLPVVQITTTGSDFDHVLNGYSAGTEALMKYLFDLGHSRIGFVYGVVEVSQAYDRLLTYRKMLTEAGQSQVNTLIQQCGITMEEGYRAGRELLSRPDRPSAVLVASDILAVAVMRAAADLGLEIPGDVSIAAFDDIPIGSFLIPRLTTVSTRPEQNGRDAVKLLFKRIAQPDSPKEVIKAGAELKIRESTGPAPVYLSS